MHSNERKNFPSQLLILRFEEQMKFRTIFLGVQLRPITTNEDYVNGVRQCKCNSMRGSWEPSRGLFKQCPFCGVLVSQTKIGVSIQLEWLWEEDGEARSVYCSIDLIPHYKIEKMTSLKLARIVNSGTITWRSREKYSICLSFRNLSVVCLQNCRR